MIFSVPGHIEMIRNGICTYPPLASGLPHFIVKTQTRRPNRGIYKVGKDYAVQSKRGVKAETDIRIVMDEIHAEGMTSYHAAVLLAQSRGMNSISQAHISVNDALAEGGYTPEEYEKAFRRINPKWDGWERWVYTFHAIEAKR